MNNKIKSFTDLFVWQEGHKLVLLIYKITLKYPKNELYSLIDQMRRAATSITSNIAEGFGRHSYKEKVQYFYLAKGSLLELTNQLLISRDIEYISIEIFNDVIIQIDNVQQLLDGIIKKSKTFI
jgi:four helix bundle protein